MARKNRFFGNSNIYPICDFLNPWFKASYYFCNILERYEILKYYILVKSYSVLWISEKMKLCKWGYEMRKAFSANLFILSAAMVHGATKVVSYLWYSFNWFCIGKKKTVEKLSELKATFSLKWKHNEPSCFFRYLNLIISSLVFFPLPLALLASRHSLNSL